METRIHNDLELYGSMTLAVSVDTYPENPKVGTLIIKGNCLYAYISIGGYLTWYPFASKTNSYIHSQGIASNTWVITHNLNTYNTWTQVKDQNGDVVIAGVTNTSANVITVNFTTPTYGTAIVVGPSTIDVPEMRAALVTAGNGTVVIDSDGIRIAGQSVLTSANITTEITSSITSVIGTLSDLTTLTKSNIVAAINEVNSKVGYSGSTGYTGSAGAGYTGSAGVNGVAGYTGSAGVNGISGYSGSTGYTGSAGTNGTVGYTGSTGAGYTGSAGVVGYTGSTGSLGYTGSVGAGYTGSSGTPLTNWAKKTANYTAVSGDRIVADTSSGTFTITLPASPTLGSYIKITDGYNFELNKLTVDPNGSTIKNQSNAVDIDMQSVDVEFFYDGSTWQVISTAGPTGYTGSVGQLPTMPMLIPLSDETSTLGTGTSVMSLRAPFGMTLTSIPRASLVTASSSGSVAVDIKVNGTSILGTNKLSIDQSEKTSVTAATPTTLVSSSIADDSEITFDITSAGASAAGLKVTLYFMQA